MSYLSIDLDYWFSFDAPKHITSLQNLIYNCRDKNKIIVDEHHEILNNINDSGCDEILHVDYHQDICYKTEPEDEIKLECGSFFWFVEKREEKSFKWFYPDNECCIEKGLGFCMDTSYKPLAKSNFIFKEQKRKCGLPSRKELEKVNHVGLAFSIDYLNLYGVEDDDSRLKEFITILGDLCGVFGYNETKKTFTGYERFVDWEDGKEILRRMKW